MSFTVLLLGVVLLLFLVLVPVAIVFIVRAANRSTGPAAPGAAPGWYPDVSDPTLMRWHDGRSWTSGTAPRQP